MKQLLRWYPAAWRERYGDEMAAHIEDELEGRPAGVGLQLSLAGRGLREHGRALVRPGDGVGGDPVREGSLAVLCSFAVFCWAGIAFQKLTEHHLPTVWPGSAGLANDALGALQGVGAAAVCIVLLVAGLSTPAVVAFIRAGGWPKVRRIVIAAVISMAVAAAGIAALAVWARQLSGPARNGLDGAYSDVYVAVAACVALVCILCAGVAVALGRRVEITPFLRWTGALGAIVVALLMGVMTALGLTWCLALGLQGAWGLVGPYVGISVALMLVATVVGGFGLAAIVRGRHTFPA